MRTRTLNQIRQAHAWHCARDAKERLGAKYENYVNAVKSLAVLIRADFGQALAHLIAQGHGSPEGHLYHHVESWLTDRIAPGREAADSDAPPGPYMPKPDGEDAPTWLLYRITQMDSVRRRRGTAEALNYLAELRPTAAAVKVGPYTPPDDRNDDRSAPSADVAGETAPAGEKDSRSETNLQTEASDQ